MKEATMESNYTKDNIMTTNQITQTTMYQNKSTSIHVTYDSVKSLKEPSIGLSEMKNEKPSINNFGIQSQLANSSATSLSSVQNFRFSAATTESMSSQNTLLTVPSITLSDSGSNSASNKYLDIKTENSAVSSSWPFVPGNNLSVSTNNSTFPFTSVSSAFSGTKPDGQCDKEDDGEDDEEGGFPIEEPEKILRNESDKSEIIYEVKCKLYRFNQTDNKEWKDAGGGNMRIIKDAETNKQQLLVRNDMGKITLNCNFYKGMKFDKLGKNGIKFLAVIDESNDLKMLLIKVNIEQLDSAISKLNAAVASI
jgi:hypothetical protein